MRVLCLGDFKIINTNTSTQALNLQLLHLNKRSLTPHSGQPHTTTTAYKLQATIYNL